MKCITDSEAAEWLKANGIPLAPFRGEERPRFYLQFYAPTAHRRIDALVRHYFDQIIPGEESMLQMTDWGLYLPSEMLAVTGIRKSFLDDRHLIDAPSHLINPDEPEVGVSLFALSASFQWTSYIYSPVFRSTLHNWEGEIFDFWTDCEETLATMRRLIMRFDLTETTPAAQARSSNG